MIDSFWWFLASLLPQVFEKIKDMGMEYFLVTSHWVQTAVMEYLYLEGKPVRIGSRVYDGRVIDGGDSSCVAEAWEFLGPCPRLFYFPDGTFVIASKVKGPEFDCECLRISYPRFFLDPDAFLKKALLRFQESYSFKGDLGPSAKKASPSFSIVSGSCGSVASFKYNPFSVDVGRKILWQPERHRKVSKLNLNELPLSQSQREVVEEIDKWAISSSWYREKKIPWRRGYLLYGDPGTGKTTFVKSISERLGASVMSWDLSTFNNDSFRARWTELSNDNSGMQIFLLEDLDTVFNGRENVCLKRITDSESRSSFTLGWDCFLSVLDGGVAAEGVLLFATTNRPELLDSSFASVVDGKVRVRPGRIDRAIQFGRISRNDIYDVAYRILGDEKKAEEISLSMQKATVAEVQEACVKKALSEFWSPPPT